MRVIEVAFDGRVSVEGYGPGFFRVGGVVRPGPLALLPDGPADWAGPPDAAPFAAQAGEIDVLLIGTGAETAHAPAEMRAGLEAAGVRFETMATPAACRTYNVLLGEGRRIAAALVPI